MRNAALLASIVALTTYASAIRAEGPARAVREAKTVRQALKVAARLPAVRAKLRTEGRLTLMVKNPSKADLDGARFQALLGKAGFAGVNIQLQVERGLLGPQVKMLARSQWLRYWEQGVRPALDAPSPQAWLAATERAERTGRMELVSGRRGWRAFGLPLWRDSKNLRMGKNDLGLTPARIADAVETALKGKPLDVTEGNN